MDEKADKPAYVMGRFAKHTLRREIVAGKGIELRLRCALHKNPIRKKFPSSAEEGRVEAKPRLGWCWSRKSICWPTPPQRFAPSSSAQEGSCLLPSPLPSFALERTLGLSVLLQV